MGKKNLQLMHCIYCSNEGAPGVSNPGISASQLFSKYKIVEQKPSQLWEKCIAQIAKIPLFVFF